jgi:transcriptional regulator with XRE-family HTH domain
VPVLKFSPNNLRTLRERSGRSRNTLGYEINRSEQMIYWYESGRAVPPVHVVCAIADVLDCELAELFEPDGVRV